MTFFNHSNFSDGDTFYTSDVNAIIANFIDLTIKQVQYSSEIDLGTKATDFSVNFGDGNRQHATLSGSADITLLTSDLTCGNFTLALDGGQVWSLDSDVVLFPSGTAPTPSTDGEDILGFYFTDRDSKFRLAITQDFE
jgi:hypothetical protein